MEKRQKVGGGGGVGLGGARGASSGEVKRRAGVAGSGVGGGSGISESSDEGSQSVVDTNKYRTVLARRTIRFPTRVLSFHSFSRRTEWEWGQKAVEFSARLETAERENRVLEEALARQEEQQARLTGLAAQQVEQLRAHMGQLHTEAFYQSLKQRRAQGKLRAAVAAAGEQPKPGSKRALAEQLAAERAALRATRAELATATEARSTESVALTTRAEAAEAEMRGVRETGERVAAAARHEARQLAQQLQAAEAAGESLAERLEVAQSALAAEQRRAAEAAQEEEADDDAGRTETARQLMRQREQIRHYRRLVELLSLQVQSRATVAAVTTEEVD
jgi:hypothetical protein